MVRCASLLTAALLALTLVVTATPGCSNQGEGERCDPNNGNSDCGSGLSCQSIEGQPAPLCCPPPPQTPSVPECFAGLAPQTDAGSESSVVPDAAEEPAEQPDAPDDVASDSPVSDVAAEAAQDAAQEASVDAAPDAAQVDAAGD